uniref:Ig-like domain-containing protein n=1 Tax=Canis lupus dingo TaxID=286419 RepID=A0A8C0KY20_CANLU
PMIHIPEILCLILCPHLCFLPGTLPKPTIWAEPGSVVPWEAPVTIWCQGSLKAQEYFLYKERYSGTWNRQPELEFKDKAKFSITHMTDVYAGQYHCYYRSTTAWSNPSDPLELVVTGMHSKPSLSVLPSSIVPSGGNVTLQCVSWTGFHRFVLMKEGQRQLFWTRNSQQSQAGLSGADFPLGPVGPFHRGRYTCYGGHNLSSQWSASSGPLDILVAGEGPQCRESPRLYTGPCEGSPADGGQPGRWGLQGGKRQKYGMRMGETQRTQRDSARGWDGREGL